MLFLQLSSLLIRQCGRTVLVVFYEHHVSIVTAIVVHVVQRIGLFHADRTTVVIDDHQAWWRRSIRRSLYRGFQSSMPMLKRFTFHLRIACCPFTTRQRSSRGWASADDGSVTCFRTYRLCADAIVRARWHWSDTRRKRSCTRIAE